MNNAGMTYTKLIEGIKNKRYEQLHVAIDNYRYIVAIEGLDGVGKTALIEPLRKNIDEKLFKGTGNSVFITKEPYLPASRKVIEESKDDNLRFYASLRSRETHFEEAVWQFKHGMINAIIMLTDRSYFSTAAYRMGCRNEKYDVDRDIELAIAAGGGVEVDIAFYLHTSVNASMDFQNQRGDITMCDGTQYKRTRSAYERYERMLGRPEFNAIDMTEYPRATGSIDRIVEKITEGISKDIYNKFYSPIVGREFFEYEGKAGS